MGDIAANFFELWGAAYMGQFSQYMYKAELYEGPFLWLVALPLAALFVYYGCGTTCVSQRHGCGQRSWPPSRQSLR